ncbi:uncharacterized protein LOC131219462 [Magnolia sinica]|uniref:uncharacterized protein LOC131219462 n=1 Tax=Magnolia sinica TaxID=86752 RepID=UPI002659D483|nr:uncharacterized protein LOC131219462 [Magnolia sinica]
MAENKRHRKVQSLTKSKPLKKTIQILLPISLLSMLFSYSPSLFPPSLSNSFNLFFSTFISILFNSYISRELVFLLCNSILVFVTRSGLDPVRSSSTGHHDEFDDVVPVKIVVPSKEDGAIVVFGTDGSDPTGSSSAHLHDDRFKVLDEDHIRVGPTIIESRDVAPIKEDGAIVVIVAGGSDSIHPSIHLHDGRFRHDLDSLQVGPTFSMGPLLDDDAANEEEKNGLLGVEGSDQRFDEFIKNTKEKMKNEARQLILMV